VAAGAWVGAGQVGHGMDSATADKLKASYDAVQPVASRFAKRLAEQIDEILTSNLISLAVPLEFRVKSWTSLLEKAERRNLETTDVAQIDDLVGIRIILLFKRDVSTAIALVANTLEITSSEDATDKLGTQSFGYQSIHLQVRLPHQWRQVPTLKEFQDLRAEVQVRTAAQHIWAAASHLLQYKKEASVPNQILRSVNRVAALLETVDLEFERALAERADYEQRARASLAARDQRLTDEKLNVDLLRKILDEYLPKKNRVVDEEYEVLLSDLEKLGFGSVGALTHLIEGNLEAVLAAETELAKLQKDQLSSRRGDEEIVLRIPGYTYRIENTRDGVVLAHAAMVRFMLDRATPDWQKIKIAE
jgi:putative GTP pyrophosphokinase